MVFFRYVPQKGSPELMRAWRGPPRVIHVLQERGVYTLDTGQKVHFERPKPHHCEPTEYATIPPPLDTDKIAISMDMEPDRSIEPINDDLSQPSY